MAHSRGNAVTEMSKKQGIRVRVVDDAVVLVITDEEGKQRTCTLTAEEAVQAGTALLDKGNKTGPDGKVPVRISPDD